MKGHIHILGICGTFMGGIALLARELGYKVTGSDANVYPPMSTQLREAGIDLMQGYEPSHLDTRPDCVVVGNAMSRGNPLVEFLLNSGLPYTSGPQWLAENVLQGRWVLAVSGTHGKTTTSSMLAWLLEYAGMSPGFLIGGVPADFGVSARLGGSDFFVVEADEYDTAFFDKRSKFVHYRPRTLTINNLEFDHADIFDDLGAIQRQFHHLLRTVPGEGLVVHPAGVAAISETLELGCWSEQQSFGLVAGVGSEEGRAIGGQAKGRVEDLSAESDEDSIEEVKGTGVQSNADSGDQRPSWHAQLTAPDGSVFAVHTPSGESVDVQWPHCGRHNVENALAAMAAARHVGVTPQHSAQALAEFKGVKRRLELLGEVKGVSVYDDFAHHPTAIATTLQGLRARMETGRLIALIEPRSNTMRMGAHLAQLAPSTADADCVYWYQPAEMDWSLQSVIDDSPVAAQLHSDIAALVQEVVGAAQAGDQIVIMSNGGFGGIHQKLLAELKG